MRLHRILWLAMLIIPMVASFASGQTAGATATEVSAIQTLPDEALETYRNDPDFIYEENASVEGLSLMDIILLKIAEWFAGAAEIAFGGGIGTIIFTLIIVALIVFIISKMFGFDLGFFYRGGKKSSAITYKVEDENIHEIDFASEIEAAMKNGHYRKVIRLIYLHMLKELSDKERINWKPHKTNADYLREMRVDPLASDFETLNYYFVYSWYGDFDVNLAQVERVRSVFDHMKKSLA
ncbi:DUF4129 domain-containing protein [Roseivirga sp. BDSF3-8]|uniref:DUF4129 domain-containing protein n=1 Tax=Roseivirga sp. BDSF3-8 TaxID=3241598 RepID=UPI003531CF88